MPLHSFLIELVAIPSPRCRLFLLKILQREQLCSSRKSKQFFFHLNSFSSFQFQRDNFSSTRTFFPFHFIFFFLQISFTMFSYVPRPSKKKKKKKKEKKKQKKDETMSCIDVFSRLLCIYTSLRINSLKK